MKMKNPYDVLGVSKSATPDEIKRAYRKLAAEHHPDRGGREQSFKDVSEAYQILSDPSKRQQYDQYGQTFEQAQRQGAGFGSSAAGGNPFGGFDFSQGFGFGSGGMEFDLGDIFGDIFGNASQRADTRARGVDLEMPLSITFEEAAFGVEKEIVIEKLNACPRCSGAGAEPGTKVVVCHVCHGQGNIKTTRRSILGTISSTKICDRCEGQGKLPESPCKECAGKGVKRGQKSIKVRIPAGIDDGQRIRIAGQGEAGYRGSAPGDLYINVRVQPSREFVREGFDLYKDLKVSFAQAVLGATIETKTLDGAVKIKIPAGTQPGRVFKVSGKGMQYLNRSGRGDLFITVNVHVPEKLNRQQKELLRQFEESE